MKPLIRPQKTVKWYLENEHWWKEILSDRYRLERIGKDEQGKGIVLVWNRIRLFRHNGIVKSFCSMTSQ